MSDDLIKRAKGELQTFERCSRATTELLITECERLREALGPILLGIEQSAIHDINGEPMRRILIAKTAEDRIRTALSHPTMKAMVHEG